MSQAQPQPLVPQEGPVRGPDQLPRLLAQLARQDWSGLLIVRSGDVERRLYLTDGRVQTAVSNDPAESLASVLTSLGAIAAEDVERAAAHVGTSDRGLALGRRLVGLGLLQETALQDGEHRRVVALAETILSLRSGVYRCEVGPPPKDMVPQALEAPMLIATAVLTRWDETWAMNVLGGMGSVLRLQPDRLAEYEATEAEEAYDLTLLRADGRAPLAEVLARGPLPEVAAVKFLAACHLIGVVDRVETAPATVTPAAAATPRPPAAPDRPGAEVRASPPGDEDLDETRPGFYRPPRAAGTGPRRRPAPEPESRRSGAGRWLLVALLVAVGAAVLWFGWVGWTKGAGEAEPPAAVDETSP